MRLYSSHFQPVGATSDLERPPVLVQDGFSWWGLVFGWLVLVRPGSWLVGLLAGIATLLIGIATRFVPAAWVLLPALHLAIALFAADWRRWELGLDGLVPGPVVGGSDRDAALTRLLERRPDLLMRRDAAPALASGRG